MATLEKIRSKAGVLIAVVIFLALLAFILGDLAQSGNSLFKNNQMEVGRINGKSISIQEFDARFNEYVEFYKQFYGQENLEESIIDNIRDQIWQSLLQEKITGERIVKAGFSVSADELFDLVQGDNPHQLVRNIFTNRETGMFEKANLINFIKNMDQYADEKQKNFWLFVEEIIEEERLYSKYYNLISKSIYYTDYEAEKQVTQNTRQYDAVYARLGFETIADSTVTITDSEYEKYYKQYKQRFKQPKGIELAYVAIDILPTAADDKLAADYITKIKVEFDTIEDVKQFVNLNSDTLFNEKFLKTNELSAELIEFGSNAKVGDVFGPYFAEGAYRLAKLASIKMLPDSVNARHILITPDQSLPVDKAEARVDSILEALKNGSDFAVLAQTFSKDGSASKGGDLGWFKDGQMVKEFNDSCFFGEINKFMKVRTQFGFHIIQVIEKGELGKKIQMGILSRTVEPSSETYQALYANASQFAGKNNTYELFKKAAPEQNLMINTVPNVNGGTRTLNDINNAREIIRWAFNNEEGAVSTVFEASNKFVVAALIHKNESGYASLDAVKEQIKSELLKDKKHEILAKRITDLGAGDIGDIAIKLFTIPDTARGLSFSTFGLPNSGYEPFVTAAGYYLKANDVKIIKGFAATFLVKVINVNEGEKTSDFNYLKNNMVTQSASRVQYSLPQVLVDDADITDRRVNFY